MKDNIAILLKTYRGDFRFISRLLDSYVRFNQDNISMYIVMPKADISIFSKQFTKYISVIKKIVPEEEIISEKAKVLAGWKVQQVVKLSFWELGLCDNYFCIDTDSYFIRNFYKDDFMYDEEVPYTILFEDKELQVDPLYQGIWGPRRELIQKIYEAIDFSQKKMLTCHGFQIFSSKVLAHLKEQFMNVKGYDYPDLLEIAPYEFSWYNLWLQKTRVIPIHVCEPIFKTFHLREHQALSYLQKISEKDIARAYIGIVVQSNWNPKKIQKYDEMKSEMWLPPEYVGVSHKLFRKSLSKVIPQKIQKMKSKVNLFKEIFKRDGFTLTFKKTMKFLGGKK